MKQSVNIPVFLKSADSFGSHVHSEQSRQFCIDLDQCLLDRGIEHCYAPHISAPVVGWVQWTCDLSLPWELDNISHTEPALYAVWAPHTATHRFANVAIDGFRQLGWMSFLYCERDETYWAYIHEFVNRIADFLRYGPSYNFFQTLPQKVVDALLELPHSRGDISSRDFELLVCDIFNASGFACRRTISGLDKETGDVFAFSNQGPMPQKIVIEAKHYSPDQPVSLGCLKQLYYGVNATEASSGILVTTGHLTQRILEHIESRRWRFHALDQEWLTNWLRDHYDKYVSKKNYLARIFMESEKAEYIKLARNIIQRRV